MTTDLVQLLRHCRFVDWLFLDSAGEAGDILLMWDSRVVHKLDEVMSQFSVSCKFWNVRNLCV